MKYEDQPSPAQDTVRVPAEKWSSDKAIPALAGKDLVIQPTFVGTIVGTGNNKRIRVCGWVDVPEELSRVQHWVEIDIDTWERL